MKHGAIILSVALLATACMVGEATHRIYLEPDGGVSWVVHEHELRSTSGPAERDAEETAFLADALLGLHPVARAFDLLGPASVDHRLLRADRPFELRTDARFHSVEELVIDLFDQLGLNGAVSLRSDDGVTHLEVVIEPCCGDYDLPDDDILALADDLSSYRIVMTEGRFVQAVGFDLLEEGVIAAPIDSEVDCEDQPEKPLVLSLSWVS